jgi:hypothetical protein
MSDNTQAVLLFTLMITFRILCYIIAAVAAINGAWWFAIVMVLVSLLIHGHTVDGETK